MFLCMALVCGCRHSQFNPHEPPRRKAESLRQMGIIKINDMAFQVLGGTNRIPTDLLQPPTNFFRLGPGDMIDIEILGEPNSQSTALVGPDGKVYYSLLPGTMVWGLTLSDTKELLENTLARYLRVKPEVVLNLRSIGSRRIWILGQVQTPGVYSLATSMTLLEAIAAAGGTPYIAGASEDIVDLENSFVMRDGRMLNVNFHQLLREGDLSQNIYLQPDDFVFVPSATAREVYVMGAVRVPAILDYSQQTSLISAISSAGGPAPYSWLSQVVIIRGSLKAPAIATVDYKDILGGKLPDVYLEPGDIVYVPLRPWYKLEQLAENILDEFVRTIAINEGRRAVLRDAGPVDVVVPLPGIGGTLTR